MKVTPIVFLLPALILGVPMTYGQKLTANKSTAVFSAVNGTAGRSDTVELNSVNGRNKVPDLNITGSHAKFFGIVSEKPKEILEGKPEKIVINFRPEVNFVGIARATLQVKGMSSRIELSGLSTKGLEGDNEPSLASVVDALGYKINLGWTTLANSLSPDLQGDELAPALFKKADVNRPVEMIPVARFSPDFPVTFGLYTNTSRGPSQHQNGMLAAAKDFPEHQILFPAFSGGTRVYDPGNEEFGFYAVSPSHTVYSEDLWNLLLHPAHAAHAMRVYPVNDKSGNPVLNTFLVCMEEAANGDYNDYVFLVRNIKPVFLQKRFTSLLNGKNLDGWYTWLETKGKNNDPEKVFTVEADGVLHDSGKEAGYIMTEKGFENYHFKLEFKWGNDKWPPRLNNKRDSGICYNVPADETDKIWPRSVECQIQEGDVGDFWLLGYSTIQVDGKQNAPSMYTRMTKKKDSEKPNGEWNTVEVISFNGKCVHIVNGVVVNYGENSSLIGGRILLQSEFAELFYRNVSIREF
ncbi:MAG TPA: DUF1080 domain-containing protein [Chryseosolibacter sp.]|nr:DUF1080 domain-containing protein [Chryseosolibacter sp.]